MTCHEAVLYIRYETLPARIHLPQRVVQTIRMPEVREIKYITLLSDRQFRIFEIIRQNSGCNATFLYESFRKKVTLRTIERDLASLRDKGVVVHTGSNKEGGYEVCTLNVVSME